MTQLQRMLTSFVAAIPAVILVYLLVMAMLSYSENLTTMAYLVMAVTLLSALATVLIPAWIMVGSKAKPVPVKVVSKKQDSEAAIEAVDEDLEEDSDVEVRSGSSGSFDAHDVLEESSEFELGNSDQDMLGGDSEAEIDTEAVDDLGDFDLEEMEDVEEEEEEETPKKKKKLR